LVGGRTMILSKTEISSDQVAKHYDELDLLYRKIWGEHVHHGLFTTGQEEKEEATLLLSKEVARLSGIQPGGRVCDIGCGYGGTSRFLAQSHQAQVLGVTISPAQLAVAQAIPQMPNLNYRLLNWLSNDLQETSFDHLISIESSEHMPDKAKFFSEAQRVLKAGGTFVICAWLQGENPKAWENRLLLEPICREGRLPSMGTETDYREFFKQHGFEVQSFSDVSHLVKRTWTLSLIGLVKHMWAHPEDLKLLLARFNSNAEFLKTLFRIRLAYETGAMRYGIFKAIKARRSHESVDSTYRQDL
jgi:tocopherol O-methyltransferase